MTVKKLCYCSSSLNPSSVLALICSCCCCCCTCMLSLVIVVVVVVPLVCGRFCCCCYFNHNLSHVSLLWTAFELFKLWNIPSFCCDGFKAARTVWNVALIFHQLSNDIHDTRRMWIKIWELISTAVCGNCCGNSYYFLFFFCRQLVKWCWTDPLNFPKRGPWHSTMPRQSTTFSPSALPGRHSSICWLMLVEMMDLVVVDDDDNLDDVMVVIQCHAMMMIMDVVMMILWW